MLNKELRKTVVQMVCRGRDGHIPSAFSIIDILAVLYRDYLKVDPRNPAWPERDYFILSKGHGCVALYAVLAQHGFLTPRDLEGFCTREGILGEHPDCTRVPGVEACTGSLGHGLSFAVGLALGLRIRRQPNKVYVLVGDGECHEGTVWEAAHVALNRRLGNLCIIVDWNGSAAQLMPQDDLPAKWRAFGWDTVVVDGHSELELKAAFDGFERQPPEIPRAIIAKTVKGRGVPMVEGHGPWHHRIPTEEEHHLIMAALS
ncbi:MAG: transketolase [Candidatus Omnitrophica bacterium]|nr:transketolase [Candidatus Omnitrophota bacterium]